MTMEQAYITWKCTGRADPALVPGFRKRRAGELAIEKLGRIVSASKGKN